MGYTFALGPVHYAGWADGRPFTLVDCFREVRGVGAATIYRPSGSTVLRNAGAMSVRATIRRSFVGSGE